jgi:type I restriction enzyme S subunit
MLVRTNDIIVGLTRPHHGSIALIDENLDHCVASTGFAVIRDVETDEIDRGFFTDALRSSICLDQMLRRSSGGNYPAITEEELANTVVPLPPLDVQRRLVAELDAARAERDRALAKAERLLTSIDKYVLAELAILLEPDPRRVFAVRRAQVQPRLDADYHSPYFQRLRRAIEHSKHASLNLGELAVFMRSGFAAGRQDQAQGDEAAVPHLRPLNLNAWGELSIAETKSVPASRVKEDDYLEQGEVLFNNTNSAEWVGKTAVFELDTPCACSNHMTRIALNPGIEPHFVAALLNAFRGIGYFSALSTFFNNQAGINTATLAALRVPVPDFETQTAIAEEVVQRKNEARRLQDHAETVWRTARSRFEQQLLQGGKP